MKFTKDVIYPGTFYPNDPGRKGKRARFVVTPERMEHWVRQRQAMKEAGLDLALPYSHLPEAKPLPKDQLEAALQKHNAGFVEDLRVVDGKLQAVCDVPRDEDADRVGKTVRGVSVKVGNYTDGSGKLWEDVIYHVALDNRPVVHGLGNFKPASATGDVPAGAETYVSLALPHELADPDDDDEPEAANSVNVQELIDLLASLESPITLADDTTAANFCERLKAALTALAGQGAGKEPTEEPHTGDILMSLRDDPNPAVRALVKNAEAERTAKRQARLEALKKRGLSPVLEKKLADALTATVSLSFGDDGQLAEAEIDRTLEALELSLPAETALDKSLVKEQPPPPIGGAISPDRAKAVADEQAANAGLAPRK